MRYIEDYTDQELTEMTDEQIAALVDLECARNGAPLMLEDEPAAPALVEFKKDFEFYTIDSFRCDQATMERVMDAIKGGVFYDQNWSTNVVKETDSSHNLPSASLQSGFSEQHYNEIKLEKESYDAKKKEYDIKKGDYDALRIERQESVDRVHERVSEAYDNIRQLDRAKSEWANYLNLSNNNKDIAMNFMKQRYEISFIKKVVPDYFAEECA